MLICFDAKSMKLSLIQGIYRRDIVALKYGYLDSR